MSEIAVYTSYGTVERPAGAFGGPIPEMYTRLERLVGEHVLSKFIGQHDVLVFLVHFWIKDIAPIR
jgi:hypothetical protein